MSSESKKKVRVESGDVSAEVDVEAILKAMKIGVGECAVLPSKNLQENLTTISRATAEKTTITIIKTSRDKFLRKKQKVSVVEVTGGKVKIDGGQL